MRLSTLAGLASLLAMVVLASPGVRVHPLEVPPAQPAVATPTSSAPH